MKIQPWLLGQNCRHAMRRHPGVSLGRGKASGPIHSCAPTPGAENPQPLHE